MVAPMKKFQNVLITLGNFPIVVVTCLFLIVTDFFRHGSLPYQLKHSERFW